MRDGGQRDGEMEGLKTNKNPLQLVQMLVQIMNSTVVVHCNNVFGFRGVKPNILSANLPKVFKGPVS